MMDLGVIGAVGIGTIIGSLINSLGSWWTQYYNAKENRKKLIFDEKKSAYLGFLENVSNGNADKVWYFSATTNLVGSPEVVEIVNNYGLRTKCQRV